MKLKFLLLAIILSPISSLLFCECWGGAFAQQYRPFPTDSAQWSIRHTIGTPFDQTSFQHKMKGDTLLNGIVYHKIYYSTDLAYSSPNEILHCFVREDTTKKVFIKYPIDVGVDTTEFMLYDFNLQVGDTTTIRLFYPTDSLFKLVVTNVDSNLFLTEYRKYIGLQPIGGWMWGGGCDDSFSWTEGLGCNIGGFLYNEFPANACFEGYVYDLVCFWHKGVYVFGGTYCDYETGTKEIETNDFNLLLYPNPATDELNIVFNDTTATTAIVEIHDLFGKLIERVPLKAGVAYNYYTQSLQKSIYVVSLYMNGKLSENKKLVLIK
ncbi:MAG: T9SS type A sorting domain-containing protein [Bacteroidia bacterium]